MAVPFQPVTADGTIGVLVNEMDSEGVIKANAIIDDIKRPAFNHSELAEEVKSYGETILDETGALAIKSREGLENIADSINNLLSKRESIISNISVKGRILKDNYDSWWREQQRKREELLASSSSNDSSNSSGNDAVSDTTNSSSTEDTTSVSNSTPDLPVGRGRGGQGNSSRERSGDITRTSFMA